jgi:hydrogenase/urease accessory protein HupE
MAWLEGVGIPYLALAALAVIEGRGYWETLARKFIELGIDLCILGIGVCGALFANDRVKEKLGDHTTAVAIAAIFVDLIIVGFCLHLRSSERRNETARAILSIFFGLLILGINSEIAFRL